MSREPSSQAGIRCYLTVTFLQVSWDLLEQFEGMGVIGIGEKKSKTDETETTKEKEDEDMAEVEETNDESSKEDDLQEASAILAEVCILQTLN